MTLRRALTKNFRNLQRYILKIKKHDVSLQTQSPGGGMVDALVSGASAARRAGSSPVLGTVKSRNSLKIKSCGISLLIFVLLLSSYFNSTEFSSSVHP